MKRAGNYYKRNRRRNSLVFLLSMSGFVLCTFLAKWSFVNDIDNALFLLLYGPSSPITVFTYLITQTASVLAFFLIVGWAMLVKQRRLASLIMLSGAFALVAVYAAKVVIARPRPPLVLPEVVAHYDEIVGYGFPSGHTALAVAIAYAAMSFTPKKYRLLLVLWVFAVAISRVSLGVHAPLDIVGGLFAGLLAASATQVLLARQKLV